MTVLTPYQSQAVPARTPGFRSMLLAEWTKLRTVRGFVVALLLAVLLPVGATLLARSGCSVTTVGPSGTSARSVACPAAPTGPDGEAVDDSFYFVHQALPANGSITAKVTGLTGEHPSGPSLPARGPGRDRISR